MGTPQFSRFHAVLHQLGANDTERAERLGVTTRTLTNWRKSLPKHVIRLAQEPELLKALADDASEDQEQAQTEEQQ
jgi:hypothetical protein